ncbi:MAG: hypothetical protein ABJB86_00015 [Bacteroidota bacterium]
MLAKTIARQHEMKLTGFKEDLNGMQNIHHPSGLSISLYFIKDTLVYGAQLPVNTLAEPLSVNSRISICLVEKGMKMPDFGGGQMPPDGGGDGILRPVDYLPEEEKTGCVFFRTILFGINFLYNNCG